MQGRKILYLQENWKRSHFILEKILWNYLISMIFNSKCDHCKQFGHKLHWSTLNALAFCMLKIFYKQKDRTQKAVLTSVPNVFPRRVSFPFSPIVLIHQVIQSNINGSIQTPNWRPGPRPIGVFQYCQPMWSIVYLCMYVV